MKTIRFFAFAALASFAISACQKEIASPAETEANLVTVNFGAETVDPSTKASMTPNEAETAFAAAWDENDQININFSAKDAEGNVLEEGTSVGTWNGSAFQALISDSDANWELKASYPYFADGSADLGSSRTQNGDKYNSKYDVMVSETVQKSGSLDKKDTDHVIVFPMKRQTAIAYFHFTSNLDEAITSATLTVTGGSIAAKSALIDPTGFIADGLLSEITVTTEGQNAKDFTLWFNVLPTSYESMSLTVNTASNSFTINREKSGSYVAGKLYKVSTVVPDNKWKEGAVEKGDELTCSNFGFINSYSQKTYTGSQSGIQYSAYACKANKSGTYAGGDMQMRKATSTKAGAYFVSTTASGYLESVEVDWADLSGASGLTNSSILVYGSNTPFEYSEETYYDSILEGSLIGTIDESTTLIRASQAYKYVGIVSNGACYISSIKITWSSLPPTPTSAAPSLTEGGVFTVTPYDITITNNEVGATVYYSTDGNDPTTSSSSFTGASNTIQVSATTTVKAMAVVDGKNNSSIVSATYTFEESIANTEETAYTTAQAIDLIDAGSSQLETAKVYVKGTVSKVDSFNSSYGSITYWLDDDIFEVYGGLNQGGAKFTGINDVVVGAEVIVYGSIQSFGSSPKVYEFIQNSELVSYTAPAAAKLTATITFDNESSLTAEGAVDTYNVTYSGDGALSVSSSAPSVATATISGSTVTVTPVAAGTTTITISAPETDNYLAVSKEYTLTVKPALVAAKLPFSFDGGVDDVSAANGMSQSGLGSDYTSSPKLKFDGNRDELVIFFDGAPKTLKYTILGNGFSGGTFTVLESADGVDYTTVVAHTELGDASVETQGLSAASRYVKFVYTTKSKGNVALGAISITAQGTLETPDFAFGNASYSFKVSDTKKVTASSQNSTGAITYSLTEGDNSKFSIDASTGDITCTTTGTYTVAAIIAQTSDYEAATATCTVRITDPGKDVSYDFSKIDFTDWSSSYASHDIKYDDCTVTFNSANKNTSTITDVPVTKGQPIIVVMKENITINSISLECKQWGSKTQTISVFTSTDGGATWSSSATKTSGNFTLSASFGTGVNAIKFTFSSSSNQIGISSLSMNITE